MLLSVSDPVAMSIVAAVSTTFMSVLTGLAGYFMLKLKQQGDMAAIQAAKAAEKVAEVAVKQEASQRENAAALGGIQVKQEKLAVVTDAVHALVNSDLGILLKKLAVSTARNYELSGTEADKGIADHALTASKDHEANQKRIDSSGSKTQNPASAASPTSPPQQSSAPPSQSIVGTIEGTIVQK